MTVKVNPIPCISCGHCCDVCPKVFEIHYAKALAVVNLVPEKFEDKCRQAEKECPGKAISIDGKRERKAKKFGL